MWWIERLAQRRIEESIERGDPDRLSNKGERLQIFDSNLPPDQRIYQQVLKNAGVVPREVELLNTRSALTQRLQKLKGPEHEAERRQAMVDLAAVETELEIKLGRSSKRPKPKADERPLLRGATLKGVYGKDGTST